MADREKKSTDDRNADVEIHTPGGMETPPSRGRASNGADLASTDMDADPSGRVEPPSPSITQPPADGPLPAVASDAAAADPAAEWRDRHLRLAAEFDNYKKRVARERSELGDRAQAGFVAKLLDVLDDLDRLVASGPGPSPEALHEGMVLVDRKLRKELEAAGVEKIDPAGQPFDPSQHEAVSVVPAPAPAQDHVVSATFQPGYRFKGVLVRPARVQVFSSEGMH
ncbi:MAG TPA: nucleotide exchange factor GrpE [Gemmatimonadales bacterium]|nr:nucleotide exchange factor GrpE [Gemmatimonadales bacterium]